MLEHPLETTEFGVVSFLERCARVARYILVLVLCEELGHCCHHRSMGIEAVAMIVCKYDLLDGLWVELGTYAW